MAYDVNSTAYKHLQDNNLITYSLCATRLVEKVNKCFEVFPGCCPLD